MGDFVFFGLLVAKAWGDGHPFGALAGLLGISIGLIISLGTSSVLEECNEFFYLPALPVRLNVQPSRWWDLNPSCRRRQELGGIRGRKVPKFRVGRGGEGDGYPHPDGIFEFIWKSASHFSKSWRRANNKNKLFSSDLRVYYLISFLEDRSPWCLEWLCILVVCLRTSSSELAQNHQWCCRK